MFLTLKYCMLLITCWCLLDSCCCNTANYPVVEPIKFYLILRWTYTQKNKEQRTTVWQCEFNHSQGLRGSFTLRAKCTAAFLTHECTFSFHESLHLQHSNAPVFPSPLACGLETRQADEGHSGGDGQGSDVLQQEPGKTQCSNTHFN